MHIHVNTHTRHTLIVKKHTRTTGSLIHCIILDLSTIRFPNIMSFPVLSVGLFAVLLFWINLGTDFGFGDFATDEANCLVINCINLKKHCVTCLSFLYFSLASCGGVGSTHPWHVLRAVCIQHIFQRTTKIICKQ